MREFGLGTYSDLGVARLPVGSIREASVSSQPALPMFGQDTPRKVWKRQRQTAREVYRRQRADDTTRAAAGRETRKGQVLRCLAAYWNRFQVSPTALELLAWMLSSGERVRDVNDVRPKLHYLFKDGLVEPRAKRTCSVSGMTVWTWAVREAGSREPR